MNITTVLKQLNIISRKWVLDSVLDAKTCLPKDDSGLGAYFDDTAVLWAIFLTNEGEIELHISFDETENTATLMIVMDDTIYTFHADVDISDTNLAEIVAAIDKIGSLNNAL